MKRKPFNLTLTTKDEIGETETFTIPDSALYYGTGQATAAEEMKIDRCIEKLCIRAYDDFDRSDVLIHDLEDKIKVVERLRKTGTWGKIGSVKQKAG